MNINKIFIIALAALILFVQVVHAYYDVFLNEKWQKMGTGIRAKLTVPSVSETVSQNKPYIKLDLGLSKKIGSRTRLYIKRNEIMKYILDDSIEVLLNYNYDENIKVGSFFQYPVWDVSILGSYVRDFRIGMFFELSYTLKIGDIDIRWQSGDYYLSSETYSRNQYISSSLFHLVYNKDDFALKTTYIPFDYLKVSGVYSKKSNGPEIDCSLVLKQFFLNLMENRYIGLNTNLTTQDLYFSDSYYCTIESWLAEVVLKKSFGVGFGEYEYRYSDGDRQDHEHYYIKLIVTDNLEIKVENEVRYNNVEYGYFTLISKF